MISIVTLADTSITSWASLWWHQRFKASASNVGDWFDHWVEKIPREINGNPLPCSCLENPMDVSLVGCSPIGCKEIGGHD